MQQLFGFGHEFFAFCLHEVRQDHFCGHPAEFVNHEQCNQVCAQKLYVQLVESDVEEVKLEVCKFEDEAFDEHRVVECLLSPMILEFCCVLGDTTECEVHRNSDDSLCN
jgi:hypothetical protein